jgi:hypothetical protein
MPQKQLIVSQKLYGRRQKTRPVWYRPEPLATKQIIHRRHNTSGGKGEGSITCGSQSVIDVRAGTRTVRSTPTAKRAYPTDMGLGSISDAVSTAQVT